MHIDRPIVENAEISYWATLVLIKGVAHAFIQAQISCTRNMDICPFHVEIYVNGWPPTQSGVSINLFVHSIGFSRYIENIYIL